jgi:hypothetical protein
VVPQPASESAPTARIIADKYTRIAHLWCCLADWFNNAVIVRFARTSENAVDRGGTWGQTGGEGW